MDRSGYLVYHPDFVTTGQDPQWVHLGRKVSKLHHSITPPAQHHCMFTVVNAIEGVSACVLRSNVQCCVCWGAVSPCFLHVSSSPAMTNTKLNSGSSGFHVVHAM